MPERALVYDVGMHVGTDSAYYLHRGYDVIAIEANPLLAEQAQRRFEREVASGRLTILNVGIGETAGTADFWVCDDWSAWSSFDRSIASREGFEPRPISVEIRPLRDVFEQHGVPSYCKVDIEGHDRYCLDGLTAAKRPAFFSVELSDHPFIERMGDLGYDRFKLIHQLSFTQPTRRWGAIRGRVPQPRLRAGLERGRGLLHGSLLDGRWYFRIGSSGPLPLDTRGPWLTYDQARALRVYIHEQFRAGRFGLLDSFDLHATTAQALAETGGSL